eukprot:2283938-Alexandrium_andersonii.AAC.1
MHASDWPARIKGYLHVPDVPLTCTTGRGRVIDYFIVDQKLRHVTGSMCVSVETPWKPHNGVQTSLAAKPLCCKLPRQLVPHRLPVAYGPDLPWGHFLARADALIAADAVGTCGLPHPQCAQSLHLSPC